MEGRKFAILHIEKYKTLTSMTKSYNHNYRRLTSRGRVENDNFANVNINKINEDKELISTYSGKDYAIDWKEKFEKMVFYKTHKLRKDAVYGFEIILTMSPEMVNKVNIMEWSRANVSWLQKEFGIENVESAMLHMDESTPHIHSYVTPILNGRYNAREILGDKVKLRKMQDDYANAMEPFGLERGIRATHARHSKLSYLQGKLEDAIEKANKEIQIMKTPFGTKESVEGYAIRVKPIIESLIAQCQKLELQNKRLNLVEKAQKEKDAYYNRIAENIKDDNDINRKLRQQAEMWQMLHKTVKEHPKKEARDFYRKHICEALLWAENQIEKEEKSNFNYGE